MLTIALIILLLPVLWFIPLRLGLVFRQEAWQAKVKVRLQIGFVRLERRLDLTALTKSGLVRLRELWRRTAAHDFVQTVKTGVQPDWDAVVATAKPPLRYLLRHVACRNLKLFVELGGYDAMQSALLSGSVWSLVGCSLSALQNWTGMEVRDPQIEIRPRFDGPAWRTQSDCILEIRLGHAMVATVWLLSRAVRSHKMRAWVRDIRRRKGAEARGGQSDPGPHEDGNGEPEGDGRRQHRGR